MRDERLVIGNWRLEIRVRSSIFDLRSSIFVLGGSRFSVLGSPRGHPVLSSPAPLFSVLCSPLTPLHQSYFHTSAAHLATTRLRFSSLRPIIPARSSPGVLAARLAVPPTRSATASPTSLARRAHPRRRRSSTSCRQPPGPTSGCGGPLRSHCSPASALPTGANCR